MFMLMLRCGLRVEEVARLTVDAVEYRRRQLFVANGKGAKDRMVYLSDDALAALWRILKSDIEGEGTLPGGEGTDERASRSPSGVSRRGSNTMRERADSRCRAIALRHTMATQLLMPMLRSPPSRIFWDIAISPRPSATAGSRTSRSSGTTTRPWRWSCNGCRHWRKMRIHEATRERSDRTDHES